MVGFRSLWQAALERIRPIHPNERLPLKQTSISLEVACVRPCTSNQRPGEREVTLVVLFAIASLWTDVMIWNRTSPHWEAQTSKVDKMWAEHSRMTPAHKVTAHHFNHAKECETNLLSSDFLCNPPHQLMSPSFHMQQINSRYPFAVHHQIPSSELTIEACRPLVLKHKVFSRVTVELKSAWWFLWLPCAATFVPSN